MQPTKEILKNRQDFVFLLRSGFYKQGQGWRGRMTSGADHCALSVCSELISCEDHENIPSYSTLEDFLGLNAGGGFLFWGKNDSNFYPYDPAFGKWPLTAIADWFEREYILPYLKKEQKSHETDIHTVEK